MSKNLLNFLLVASIFALYFLLIGPLYKGVGGVWQPQESVQSLIELNKQYDEALAQADSLAVQAKTLKTEYDRVNPEEKAKMQIMVPDSIDKVRLLSEISGIVASTGLVVSDLSYGDGSASPNGRGSVIVSFMVRTTYPNFKEFIGAFEKSMRLFSIQSVAFTVPEKQGDLTTYQVRLEAYYIK